MKSNIKETWEVYDYETGGTKMVGMGYDRSFATSDLIGMTEQAARDLCLASDYRFRVTSRDGAAYVCTQDFRLDRLNVNVSDGLIVSANIG